MPGRITITVSTPELRRIDPHADLAPSQLLRPTGACSDRHGTSPPSSARSAKHAADVWLDRPLSGLVVHARVARVHRVVRGHRRGSGQAHERGLRTLDRIRMGHRTRAAGLCLLPFRDLHRPFVPDARRRARCGHTHRPLRHVPLGCGPGPPLHACARRLQLVVRPGGSPDGHPPNRLRRVARPSWPGSSPSCALRDVADVAGNRRLSSWWRAFHRCGCRSRTSSILRISSPWD